MALQANPLSENTLPRRTLPYRNKWIIMAIRDLYFTRGITSWAHRFGSSFPTVQGNDGVMRRQVPVSMVALVATAVRAASYYHSILTNVMNQLYAAIHEWRNGTKQDTEFYMSSVLDVYLGHVHTFEYIKNNGVGRFNTILTDIYAQAR
jgi:hypothetical protein